MSRSLKAIFLLLFAAGLAFLIWGLAIEPDQLIVHHETLAIETLPPGLAGMRIAVLSDLHIGAPHIDLDKLKDMVQRTNDLRPDVIVLLGDYVIHGVLGGDFVEPEAIAKELGVLKAPLGIYAILGNHDWWFDGPRVQRALAGVGITVMENSSAKLSYKGQRFWFIGMADMWTREPDFEKALKGIPEKDAVIALTHNPDLFPDVPPTVLFTLAGHTHGGQVYLPVVGRMIVPSQFGQRFAAGHIHEGAKHMFVTVGLGTSIFPIRFRVPPEIVILTLKNNSK